MVLICGGLRALRAYGRGIGARLTPLQVGVDTQGGTEIVAHSLAPALAEDPETVVISVDMANAFNSIHQAALFTAVQKSTPALLPMVQWAYGDETPLHIVGAPGALLPSYHSVERNRATHRLRFWLRSRCSLCWSGLMQRVGGGGTSSGVNITSKLTPAAGEFRRLCLDDDGARSIGLEPQFPKCGIYVGDEELVAEEAANLWIAHQLNSFIVVGTPLGSAEYVSNALRRRAATVETLLKTLVQLPLSEQSQFLLLRASLQAHMAHLTRTVPSEALASHVHRTDAAVWRGAAAVLDLPPGEGEYVADMECPDKACGMLGRQMMLPLRHGRHWPSRAQSEGAPSCALTSARG